LDNGLSRKAIDRRRFLRLCGMTTAAGLLPAEVWALVGRDQPSERAIALFNIHTGESFDQVYCVDGVYLPDAMAGLDRLLRDHRTGEVGPIDGGLIDQLHTLAGCLETSDPFHVISGYRSADTNAALRRAGHGAAKRSYHLSGQAVDVRLPCIEYTALHRAARDLHAGGVGDYAGRGFVHLDTGPVRTWK
jgi:uncharacterized protein YcbK (DUF882 family)